MSKRRPYIGFWSVLLAVIVFPLSLLSTFVKRQSPSDAPPDA